MIFFSLTRIQHLLSSDLIGKLSFILMIMTEIHRPPLLSSQKLVSIWIEIHKRMTTSFCLRLLYSLWTIETWHEKILLFRFDPEYIWLTRKLIARPLEHVLNLYCMYVPQVYTNKNVVQLGINKLFSCATAASLFQKQFLLLLYINLTENLGYFLRTPTVFCFCNKTLLTWVCELVFLQISVCLPSIYVFCRIVACLLGSPDSDI